MCKYQLCLTKFIVGLLFFATFAKFAQLSRTNLVSLAVAGVLTAPPLARSGDRPERLKLLFGVYLVTEVENWSNLLFPIANPKQPITDMNWLQTRSCFTYLQTVAILHSTISVMPEERLGFLEYQVNNCLPEDRVKLLAPARAEAFWQLQQHEEVCYLLSSIGAVSQLLTYAETSANDLDWLEASVYLQCVRTLEGHVVWISPWRTSSLYYRLGQQYESQGDIDQAIESYREAAFLYPTVWHTPYLAGARLYVQQGKIEDALLWLTDAVRLADNPTASFYLWQEIGRYWSSLHNEQEAYCAFRNAYKVLDEVPSQNITSHTKETFIIQYKELQTNFSQFVDYCD
jgi:tetratricopeptide (TPR) repeat protein